MERKKKAEELAAFIVKNGKRAIVAAVCPVCRHMNAEPFSVCSQCLNTVVSSNFVHSFDWRVVYGVDELYADGSEWVTVSLIGGKIQYEWMRIKDCLKHWRCTRSTNVEQLHKRLQEHWTRQPEDPQARKRELEEFRAKLLQDGAVEAPGFGWYFREDIGRTAVQIKNTNVLVMFNYASCYSWKIQIRTFHPHPHKNVSRQVNDVRDFTRMFESLLKSGNVEELG